MSASSVGPVKAMVRSLFLPALESFMTRLFDLPDRSVREKLRNFAIDHVKVGPADPAGEHLN